MDTIGKLFIPLVLALAVFAITKHLVISEITYIWIFFMVFFLPYQVFVVGGIFSLIYYLLFKSIDFIVPTLIIIMGLILSIIPKTDKHTQKEESYRDPKIVIAIIMVVLLFLTMFLQSEYQKQRREQKSIKQVQPQKIIINLQ